MVDTVAVLEASRKLAMVFDSSVRETSVDRHDHNSVIEGNVIRSVGDYDSRFIGITVVVIIVCVVLAYAIKISVEKCIEKVVKAVRREVSVSAPNV